MMADPPGQVAIAVASVLGRFSVRLAYATESATAAVLVAEIIADADGGLIAIDIETAPTPAEQQRRWAIRLKLADAVGRLKALTRLKTSRERAALRAGRTAATLEAVDTATADLAEAKGAYRLTSEAA